MLVQSPPVALTGRVVMLGTNQYPLFLVKGAQQGAIFEGGVGAMGPLVLEQLEGLGIARDYVKQVIVTHAHPDHVMAVPLFRRAFPGVQVAASKVAAKTLTVEKAVGFFSKIDGALTEALAQAGLIGDQHRPEPLTEAQIAVDRVIEEGDRITVDGMSFVVLETPGHSDCSLSFHEPLQKILVISDATGFYVPPDYWWPCYFVDYGCYLSSIERLAALDAEVLCLSHNGAITGAADVKAYFGGAIAATRAYHQRIIAEARAGKGVRDIAGRLGAEIHQRTGLLPLDFFQKNCALLVKRSLEHEGIEAQR